jgi:hypothetical protein
VRPASSGLLSYEGMGAEMTDQRQRQLLAAGIVFAVGSAVHMVDHLRRGDGSVSDALQWAGTLALVLQVAVVTLIVTRHRLAPIAAVAAGFPLAVGFLAAHWLPEWSPLSDPVWEIDSLSWFSYTASLLEIAGALAIAVAGLAAIRDQGGLTAFAAGSGGR